MPDLLRFARVHLGPAPGELAEAIALNRATSHRINARAAIHPGWIAATPPRSEHRVLFHNGGTGGYRSLLVIAPEHDAAVVILSANNRSVDRPGLDLLKQIIDSGSGPNAVPVAAVA